MLQHLLVATAVVVFTLSVAVSAQATASLEEVQERHKDVLGHKNTYDRAIASAKEAQKLIDRVRRTLEREEAKLQKEEAEYEKIEKRIRDLADNPDIRIGELREANQRYENAADYVRVQIEITQEDENRLAELEEDLAKIKEMINSRNDEIRRIESKQDETVERIQAEELHKRDEILQKLQETVIEYQGVVASHMKSCGELIETMRGAREAIIGTPEQLSMVQRWGWTPHSSWLQKTAKTMENETLLDEMAVAIQSMGISFPDGDQEQFPVLCE